MRIVQWLIVIVLGLCSIPVAAEDLSSLQSILHRDAGHESIDSDDFSDENLKVAAKFVLLVPLLDQIDPVTADGFKVRLAGYLAADDSVSDYQPAELRPGSGGAKLPGITAGSYVVYDLDQRQVVMAFNSSFRQPIASISKLFTAMVALDNFAPDQEFVMTQAAKTVGSESYLSIGDRFSLWDALAYLHIRSSNDIANQLQLTHDATHYPGAFVDQMNYQVQKMGLVNTSFDDPSGLSEGNQSTASDLVNTLMYMQAHYPELLRLSHTPTVVRNDRVLISSNPMRRHSDIWRGGKNGYISASGRTLASIVEYQGKNYVVVALGSDYHDEAADTILLLTAL